MLLYDGDCRLCRLAARVVARLDRRQALGILPFQDLRAAPYLARVPEQERFSSWHLVFPDGRRATRGELGPLLALIPATRRLVPLARRLPLERLYELVSRRRGRLARLLPDGPAPRRAP
ncbi:MAG TPA: DCC1-like thiol-disulfide oxidoreductase family protein [Gaiellaceae bacterium]|nr:DCC1-like thiol-disulfide oxidoreductase family protein [Gaiellaceae bacterium]